MIERPVERRAPLPPVLGRRVELLGLLAFVLFAVVAFFLWRRAGGHHLHSHHRRDELARPSSVMDH